VSYERLAEIIVKIIAKKDNRLSYGNKVFIVKHILETLDFEED